MLSAHCRRIITSINLKIFFIMKTLRTTMAVALLGLALAAFQSSALAQTRRTGTGPSTSRSVSSSRPASVTRTVSSTQSSKKNTSAVKGSESKQVSRPSVTKTPNRKPAGSTVTRPSTSVSSSSKPATQVTRPASGTKPRPSTGTQVTRPASGTKPRPSTGTQVTRPVTVTKPEQQRPTRPAVKPGDKKPAGKPGQPIDVTRPGHRPGDRKPGSADIRPGNPVQVRPDHKPDPHRVHPRDRDFMHYSKPSYYWTSHNHCYGHRVRVLPSHSHRHIHFGVTYYCYNDIWYRPYGGYYVVCRPPFGTVLAANIIADMTWAAINFSYYYTVSQMYDQMNENNEYIAQQNALIAQNNAIIAEQNAMIAAGQQQAQAAYALANELGLIQSYAAAGSTYYYQDGVFYTVDANGQYSVIIPPAGALVETLPEDYDMVVLADGKEYYKVDDTVYRVTIVEGKPYFEVLGQLLQ